MEQAELYGFGGLERLKSELILFNHSSDDSSDQTTPPVAHCSTFSDILLLKRVRPKTVSTNSRNNRNTISLNIIFLSVSIVIVNKLSKDREIYAQMPYGDAVFKRLQMDKLKT